MQYAGADSGWGLSWENNNLTAVLIPQTYEAAFTTTMTVIYKLEIGAPAGGRGEASPPPETKKIVGEKLCYFPELYKMTKVREAGIENG